MFLLIALVLVIIGIYVLVTRNQWAGIAIIAVGVLVFLLRHALDDGLNDDEVLGALVRHVLLR